MFRNVPLKMYVLCFRNTNRIVSLSSLISYWLISFSIAAVSIILGFKDSYSYIGRFSTCSSGTETVSLSSQVPEVARGAIGPTDDHDDAGSNPPSPHLIFSLRSVACLLYFIRCSGNLSPDTCWSALIMPTAFDVIFHQNIKLTCKKYVL